MKKSCSIGQRSVFCALLLCFSLTAGADDFQDANSLFKQGQHAKALEKVNSILANKPKDAQARFLKGLILVEENKPNDAIAVFTALTNDYPELPEPYNNLAVLYAGLGQYEKAKVALEVAIRTHPSYATAHENLGDIYAKMASQAYDRALQLDRSNAKTQTKLELIRELFGTKAAKPAKTASAAATPAAPIAPAAETRTAPADAGDAAILKMTNDWSAAWSTQDVKRYLSFYAPDFKTPGGEDRAAWEKTREERISAPKFIQVSIENAKVSKIDDTHASVTFKQIYQSSKLNSTGTKTLLLVKSGNSWQIQEEQAK
ncbi:tetratricopeptide repeat protein [Ferriphaselus sp. R-1]|uniref:nuclear transport factor 2 family protein n=1 Tax=Ferriphaselus sp. R-1 TaxID=1485544 RepID=UPI0005534331|nr:tetratricopeptide repeat protein [Ferriphaselus sp. R-1]